MELPDPQREHLHRLEERIARKNLLHPTIQTNAHARIVWQDVAQKEPTPYSIVYLHGFSASPMEGYPIHLNIAKQMDCNLYLSRLPAHGEHPDAFTELTAQKLISSAKEAVSIGKELGERVILMGTSTGGTLSLIAAASDPDIAALLLYSPLIDFYDWQVRLLKNPLINRLIGTLLPGEFTVSKSLVPERHRRIWYPEYPVAGPIALAKLVREQMTPELFKQIHQPAFVGYYYNNRSEQDQVVSVDAIKQMVSQLATPDGQKSAKAFPEASNHVISHGGSSKAVAQLEAETLAFLQKWLDGAG